MLTYFWLTVAIVLLALDQLIKLWAQVSLSQVDTIPIFENILHLTYRRNYGAAFSILQNQQWLLIPVTSLVMLVMAYLLISKKIKHPVMVAAVSLVLSGGVGNLMDRIFREGGYVVDYIDFRLINFPVFNLADICVVCGTALLFLYVIVLEPRLEKQKKLEENSRHDG